MNSTDFQPPDVGPHLTSDVVVTLTSVATFVMTLTDWISVAEKLVIGALTIALLILQIRRHLRSQ